MYFATDIENKKIQNEHGDTFTADQFKKIIERGAEKDKFYDMTLMTQRFIMCGYDFDALEKEYQEIT